MTFFIFAGDMLVMLFMTCVVVWLFLRASDEKTEFAARIPLQDEVQGSAQEGEDRG